MAIRAPLMSIVLAASLAVSAPARRAESQVANLATQLKGVSVVRTGEVESVGKSVPLPARGTRGITFSAPVREGPKPRDGHLQLARSQSGLALWSLRAWDDATDDSNLFSVQPGDPAQLPPGAVLQFVDGVWESVAPHLLGTFGRTISKTRGGAVELLLEAWLALPEERLIYRPADKKLYPLVPARGKYDASNARRLQWMLFSKTCPEVKGPCVYFGAPLDVCRRNEGAVREGEVWIWPYGC
jgi:hypothetical protein